MSNMKDVIEESFRTYAAAVSQSRALVDVRDASKPSLRQILYCMFIDKYVHEKPFQKTLKCISSAFKCYLHG